MRNIGIVSLIAIFVTASIWLFKQSTIEDLAQNVQENESSETTLALRKPTHSEKTQDKPISKGSESNLFEIEARAEYLLSCLENVTCDYPQTDPRSYGYALGGDMIKLLDESEALMEKNELSQDKLTKLSHAFLMVPNGHVQAKAIELIEKLPVSQETFSKLEQVFSNNFDSVLLSKSMSLLESYHQQDFSVEVDNLLLQQVQTGGHFVRQTLSAQVLPFINQTNMPRYQLAAQALPKNSLEHKQLKAVLEEYQRIAQGG